MFCLNSIMNSHLRCFILQKKQFIQFASCWPEFVLSFLNCAEVIYHPFLTLLEWFQLVVNQVSHYHKRYSINANSRPTIYPYHFWALCIHLHYFHCRIACNLITWIFHGRGKEKGKFIFLILLYKKTIGHIFPFK